MNIQIIILSCFLLVINTNLAIGQESNLSLKINRTDKQSILRCELKNISNEKINIEEIMTFDRLGNMLQVETPNGVVSSLGLVTCGSNQPVLSIAPQEKLSWDINLNIWYFSPYSFREYGTYKFYWVVNNVKSDPFIYEYARDK